MKEDGLRLVLGGKPLAENSRVRFHKGEVTVSELKYGGGIRMSGKRHFGLAFSPRSLVAGLASLLALAASGALPDGYTRLAFLESSGTQYIDTGVVFGKTNGFSITYAMVKPGSFQSWYQAVCGSRNDANSNTRCILGSNSLNVQHIYTNGTSVATNWYERSVASVGWNSLSLQSTSDGVQDNAKGTADVNFRNSGLFYCRRTKSGTLGELTAQTAPFYLFAAKAVSPSNEIFYSRARIWEARISAGADVIRHFVAARRDSDSELGMYDLVNDVFYTNQGTGAFIGGAPVQESGRDAYTRLTWLESTGGQFIDTGVTATDAHGFAVTYLFTKSEGNANVCGSRASSGDTRCVVGSNSQKAYVGWNTLLTSHAIPDGDEGVVKVNYLNSRTWDCRGLANGNLGTLAAQTGTFYLFAGNMAYSGGSMVGGSCRIMSFTMTRGSEVVMDLIPVRRKSDGKPGMYDVLNDEFYVNQGSQDFIEGEPLFPDGYIGLDFIESTGTQYINTGVKCASDVTMQANVYNARSASKHFMGARTAYLQNALGLSFQTEGGSEGYCVAWGSQLALHLLGYSNVTGVGDHFHEFVFGGRYIQLEDGFSGTILPVQDFTTDLDIYAFTVNNGGTPHNQMSAIRVSSLKMYKSGALVRDYIPVMPTNSLAPGLYDLQNDVFYGNVGTGQFLAGEIVRGIDAPDAFAGEGVPVSEIAGTETATKTFNLQHSGLYRLWFQYGSGTAGSGHSVTVKMDGRNVGSVTTATKAGWTTAHYDVRLRAGAHALTLQGSRADKSTRIDAVTLRCLQQIPTGTVISVR